MSQLTTTKLFGFQIKNKHVHSPEIYWNQAAKALEDVLKVQGIKDINITKIKHKHHEKGTNSRIHAQYK